MCATAGSSSTKRTRTSSSVVDPVELMVGSSRAARGEAVAGQAILELAAGQMTGDFRWACKAAPAIRVLSAGEKQVRRPGGSQGGASKEGGSRDRFPGLFRPHNVPASGKVTLMTCKSTTTIARVGTPC